MLLGAILKFNHDKITETMDKDKILASSPTAEGITAMINKYFYSSSYIVNDDGSICNTKTGKTLTNFAVKIDAKRYKFVQLNTIKP